MNIRPVESADTERLVPLMLSYIVDFYRSPHPGEPAVWEWIEHLLDHPDKGIQFVAKEQDGELVGFATLYFTLSTLQLKPVAILNDLFVHPSARGRKVGELLFRHCLEYIREHAFAYMQWETDCENKAAQALYNKMGGHLSNRLFYEMD